MYAFFKPTTQGGAKDVVTEKDKRKKAIPADDYLSNYCNFNKMFPSNVNLLPANIRKLQYMFSLYFKQQWHRGNIAN